jgi:pyroglutamyl-peptidase
MTAANLPVKALYYSVLDYPRQFQLRVCIFIHVSILTKEKSSSIVDDFLLIIHRVAL